MSVRSLLAALVGAAIRPLDAPTGTPGRRSSAPRPATIPRRWRPSLSRPAIYAAAKRKAKSCGADGHLRRQSIVYWLDRLGRLGSR